MFCVSFVPLQNWQCTIYRVKYLSQEPLSIPMSKYFRRNTTLLFDPKQHSECASFRPDLCADLYQMSNDPVSCGRKSVPLPLSSINYHHQPWLIHNNRRRRYIWAAQRERERDGTGRNHGWGLQKHVQREKADLEEEKKLQRSSQIILTGFVVG